MPTRWSNCQKISAAFAAGRLSYSKVRALSRIADEANEDYLLMIGTYGTAHHVEKLVARYRRALRLQDAECAEAVYEGRTLSVHFDDDGALVLNGRFPAEQGAVILKAIDMACDMACEMACDQAFSPDVAIDEVKSDTGSERNRPPVGQRRADALATLSEAFLNQPENAGNTADRYQVVVHVTEHALYDDAHSPAETGCGSHQPAEVAAAHRGIGYDQFPRSENPPAETYCPYPSGGGSETQNRHTGESQLTRSNAGSFHLQATASGDQDPPAETLQGLRESAPPGLVAPGPGTPESEICGSIAAPSSHEYPPAETPHIENGPHLTASAARRIACDCSGGAAQGEHFR